MGALSMSQARRLRGVRGLGADFAPSDVTPGMVEAQEEVDRANERVPGEVTNLTFGSPAPRPMRVSPLDATWAMPFQGQAVRSQARGPGFSLEDAVIVGGAFLFGAVALRLIFRS